MSYHLNKLLRDIVLDSNFKVSKENCKIKCEIYDFKLFYVITIYLSYNKLFKCSKSEIINIISNKYYRETKFLMNT